MRIKITKAKAYAGLGGFILSLVLLSMAPSASPMAPSSQTVPTLDGQTSTLLPDGRSLLLGGNGPNGPLGTALIWDPHNRIKMTLPDELQHPRAGHTATMLPNGTVLILGGVDKSGDVISSVELYDPATQRFVVLPSATFAPRAYHTATVLTEGRVLITGGLSAQSAVLDLAELWNPQTQTSQSLPNTLRTARQGHTASLMWDGTVLLWGGRDKQGRTITTGEFYDPDRRAFSFQPVPPFTPQFSVLVEASVPQDGATGVPLNPVLALRFSRSLQSETLRASTVTLSSANGSQEITIVPAETGMLAFLTPKAPLLPGMTYQVSFNGPRDVNDFLLSSKGVSFTTQGLSDQVGLGGIAVPGVPTETTQGSPTAQLPVVLQARAGVTALTGQVLTQDGKPLPSVTLQIEDKKVKTDQTGRFLLIDIPVGWDEMIIDGRTANRGGVTYGIFEVAVNITPGQTNILPYTIWMPVIDTARTVRIPSPTTKEVVITTPGIPGLELHIPPGTVITDQEDKVVRNVSITPIPVDRPPFALPENVIVPIYFTIQPGTGYVKNTSGLGARVIYPNYTHAPPGTRFNFWHYDVDEHHGWYVYGQGTVTPNGKQVVPDPGVMIYEFTGAMINAGLSPPPTGPVPTGTPPGGAATPPSPPEPEKPPKDGEPVDLGTGLFVLEKTDLFLPDVIPITLTRTYRSGDTATRPFGIGTNYPYGMFLWSAQQYQEADLVLPDGGRVHYVRISPGTGFTDAVFEHTATPTAFYKSRITWNGLGWDLALKNGTVYVFGDTAPLQSIRDRYGNTITLTRTNGQAGNITKLASPNGRWIELTYDTSNRINQAKDNIGRVVSYTYDASGRLWKVTDLNGGVTEYSYDSSHRMLTIKDARGITYLTNTYDATSGRVTDQVLSDGTYHFAYTVDGSGKIIQTDVTDPRTFIRRIAFNSSGYTVTDTQALGQAEARTLTYERQSDTNLLLSVTDNLGAGRKTAYAYDVLGNVQSTTRLAGTGQAVTTSYTYEPMFNQVATVTDPLTHTTTFGYDASGKLTSITNALGKTWTVNLNNAGQALSSTSPSPISATTSFTYDTGDLASITDSLARVTTRFNDSVGRLVSLTNPLGQLTRYDYDALNRLTTVTDPKAGQTIFTYDENSNLKTVKDANQHTTSYQYDTMDRLQTRTDPLTKVETYGYDSSGNLTSFTDRKGQITNIVYDPLNRRKVVTYQDASTTTYTWDTGNRLTQIVDSLAGTITRTYDDLDRLTSETTPQGSVSYTYDGAGRRISMTVAGQPPVIYTYDNANQLRTVTQSSAQVVLDYDEAGRRKSLTLPNGVMVAYGYDAASQLRSLTYNQGATVLGNLTYDYDLAGNRMKVGGSWAQTGLPQAVTSAGYDNANHQFLFGATTMTYDFNGNLTTAQDSSGSATYGWDVRNRMTSITAPGFTAGFAYDAMGRRTMKTVNGVSTGFVYDRMNPVQEKAGALPTANLLTGLGIDEYFTRTDSTGTRTILSDALGSSVALADTSGTVQTQYTYEPFGNTTPSGATSTNSFQYTGRENDGTGLYYLRARYYSPVLQRFISEDPFSFVAGDTNFYNYVLGRPTRLRDPFGLQSQLIEVFSPSIGPFTIDTGGGSLFLTPISGSFAGGGGISSGTAAIGTLEIVAGVGLLGAAAIAAGGVPPLIAAMSVGGGELVIHAMGSAAIAGGAALLNAAFGGWTLADGINRLGGGDTLPPLGTRK